ncbi:hypothetical protein IWQ61_005940 [Dispira simplex]|nr:hypothetical protein IWQ61_005940 [Dispira simplex]
MSSSPPLTSSSNATLGSHKREISKDVRADKRSWVREKFLIRLATYETDDARDKNPKDLRSSIGIRPHIPIASSPKRESPSRVLLPPPIITSQEILRKRSSSRNVTPIPSAAFAQGPHSVFAIQASGDDNRRRLLPHVSSLDPRVDVSSTPESRQRSPHFLKEIHEYRVTSPHSWLNIPCSGTRRSYPPYQTQPWPVRTQPRAISPPLRADSARPAQALGASKYFAYSRSPGPYPDPYLWEMEVSYGPSTRMQGPHSSGGVSGGYSCGGMNISPRSSQRLGSPPKQSWNRHYSGKNTRPGPSLTHRVSPIEYHNGPYITEHPSGHSQLRKSASGSSDHSPLAYTSTGPTSGTSWPLSTKLGSDSPSSRAHLHSKTRPGWESPSKDPVTWGHSTPPTSSGSAKGKSKEMGTSGSLGEPSSLTRLGSSTGKGKGGSPSPEGKRKGGIVTAKIAGEKAMVALRRKLNANKRQKMQQTDQPPRVSTTPSSLLRGLKRSWKTTRTVSNSEQTSQVPLRTSSTSPTYHCSRIPEGLGFKDPVQYYPRSGLPIVNRMVTWSHRSTPSPVFLEHPNDPQYLLSPVDPTLSRVIRSVRATPDYLPSVGSSLKPTPTVSGPTRLPPFQTLLSITLSERNEPPGE